MVKTHRDVIEWELHMGIDFVIEVVKPISNTRFEKVGGERSSFSVREHGLMELFHPTHNKKVQTLLKKSVSFDWFKNKYTGCYDDTSEQTLKNCWSPSEILACIEAVYQALKDNDNEFPPTYRFSTNKESHCATTTDTIYYEGTRYNLFGNGGRVVAIGKNERIDFTDKKALHGYECLEFRDEKGKWINTPGKEITIYISKRSYFEEYKEDLNEMMAVCKYAIKNNYLIITYSNY
jgi:hypothetical protein